MKCIELLVMGNSLTATAVDATRNEENRRYCCSLRDNVASGPMIDNFKECTVGVVPMETADESNATLLSVNRVGNKRKVSSPLLLAPPNGVNDEQQEQAADECVVEESGTWRRSNGSKKARLDRNYFQRICSNIERKINQPNMVMNDVASESIMNGTATGEFYIIISDDCVSADDDYSTAGTNDPLLFDANVVDGVTEFGDRNIVTSTLVDSIVFNESLLDVTTEYYFGRSVNNGRTQDRSSGSGAAYLHSVESAAPIIDTSEIDKWIENEEENHRYRRQNDDVLTRLVASANVPISRSATCYNNGYYYCRRGYPKAEVIGGHCYAPDLVIPLKVFGKVVAQLFNSKKNLLLHGGVRIRTGEIVNEFFRYKHLMTYKIARNIDLSNCVTKYGKYRNSKRFVERRRRLLASNELNLKSAVQSLKEKSLFDRSAVVSSQQQRRRQRYVNLFKTVDGRLAKHSPVTAAKKQRCSINGSSDKLKRAAIDFIANDVAAASLRQKLTADSASNSINNINSSRRVSSRDDRRVLPFSAFHGLKVAFQLHRMLRKRDKSVLLKNWLDFSHILQSSAKYCYPIIYEVCNNDDETATGVSWKVVVSLMVNLRSPQLLGVNDLTSESSVIAVALNVGAVDDHRKRAVSALFTCHKVVSESRQLPNLGESRFIAPTRNCALVWDGKNGSDNGGACSSRNMVGSTSGSTANGGKKGNGATSSCSKADSVLNVLMFSPVAIRPHFANLLRTKRKVRTHRHHSTNSSGGSANNRAIDFAIENKLLITAGQNVITSSYVHTTIFNLVLFNKKCGHYYLKEKVINYVEACDGDRISCPVRDCNCTSFTLDDLCHEYGPVKIYGTVRFEDDRSCRFREKLLINLEKSPRNIVLADKSFSIKNKSPLYSKHQLSQIRNIRGGPASPLLLKNTVCNHRYIKSKIVPYFELFEQLSCPYYTCPCTSFDLRDLVDVTSGEEEDDDRIANSHLLPLTSHQSHISISFNKLINETRIRFRSGIQICMYSDVQSYLGIETQSDLLIELIPRKKCPQFKYLPVTMAVNSNPMGLEIIIRTNKKGLTVKEVKQIIREHYYKNRICGHHYLREAVVNYFGDFVCSRPCPVLHCYKSFKWSDLTA